MTKRPFPQNKGADRRSGLTILGGPRIRPFCGETRFADLRVTAGNLALWRAGLVHLLPRELCKSVAPAIFLRSDVYSTKVE
jgi:hypothetical protein